MYVTTSILALEAGHAFKRKLPWVAPFTLVSLVTTVETVDGKTAQYFLWCFIIIPFFAGVGRGGRGWGGGGGSLKEILKCDPSKESC